MKSKSKCVMATPRVNASKDTPGCMASSSESFSTFQSLAETVGGVGAKLRALPFALSILNTMQR